MLYPDVAYPTVCPTRMWRTLEYATTKEECTLESKSCLESVVATAPKVYYLKQATLGKQTAVRIPLHRGTARDAVNAVANWASAFLESISYINWSPVSEACANYNVNRTSDLFPHKYKKAYE